MMASTGRSKAVALAARSTRSLRLSTALARAPYRHQTNVTQNGLWIGDNNDNDNNTCLLFASNLQQQQRWFSRKAAKMGQHLASLEEQAHSKDKQQAKERRKKKKARKKGHSDADQDDDEEGDMSASGGRNSSEPQIDEVSFDDEKDDDDEEEDDGPVLPDPTKLKSKMKQVLDRLETSFRSIRGAEPTPELFDSITVQAYGAATPLSAVAQVVIVSPTLATATCFDPALAHDVEMAIRDTLDLNPKVEDDGSVKIPLPRVSMEFRTKTVKQLQKQAEKAKTKIRNLRRKAIDIVKKGQSGKLEGISKDDAFRAGKQIEAVTTEISDDVTVMLKKKEEDVMKS